jgi:hypothetical protein
MPSPLYPNRNGFAKEQGDDDKQRHQQSGRVDQIVDQNVPALIRTCLVAIQKIRALADLRCLQGEPNSPRAPLRPSTTSGMPCLAQVRGVADRLVAQAADTSVRIREACAGAAGAGGFR